MRFGRFTLLSVLLFLLTVTPVMALGTTPAFEPAPCLFAPLDGLDVECGYLIVLEDRSNLSGPTISLPVAIVHSLSDAPEPDPLIYLSGGPGGYLLDSVDYYAGSLAPFLETRDLILFDQRGVGFSEPALNCPEIQQFYYDTLDDDLGYEEAVALQVDAARQCSERLTSEGVNLAVYNTSNSAADVADLLTVLGYDEWNIMGVSYGTRLALTIMRDHPESVRSVIIDSVVPLQEDGLTAIVPAAYRAFSMLFEGCAVDLDCDAVYPDLEDTFWRLVEELNANPVIVPVEHPYTGEMYDMLFSGDVLVDTLFRSLYSTYWIGYMPRLIEFTDDGYYEPMANFAMYHIARFEYYSLGMYYSVNCHDDVSFISRDDVLATAEQYPRYAYVTFVLETEMAICEIWEAGVGSPIENEAVYSDIPTLVVSGEYDPITPPERGALAAETLPNSFVYEFPGLGHGVVFDGGCPMNIAIAFIDAPTIVPDSSCIGEMDAPDFVTE